MSDNTSNEFAPLSLERLQELARPERNGPVVVSMARELIGMRAILAELESIIK